MLKNITQMNKPLIGRFLKSFNFYQQPGPVIAVAIDKFYMGVRFLKLLIVSLTPAAILNIFCPSKNRGKVFRV